MAKKSDSLIIYTAYADKFQKLTDEQFGQLMRAIIEYQRTGAAPDMSDKDTAVELAFDVIKFDLDANNEKYEATVEKRREAGAKGGKKKAENYNNDKQNEANLANASKCKQSQANQADNDNVNDNDNYIKKDSPKGESKEKRFAPPSLDEVKEYCQERNNGIDPQRFINFYEAKGWMIGKNKMKNWKAAVRNWESRDKSEVPKESKAKEWGRSIYDPAQEQNAPRFGFPPEWFNGKELITEYIKPVIHPEDRAKGIYEEYEVTISELKNLYELRRRYYEQRQ